MIQLGHQVVVATREHEASVAMDKRFSVGVQVAEHGVTTSAPNYADFVRVKASKEEGHGAAGPKGTSGKVAPA